MAKKTEIIVVLDRSGSMERIRKETMAGFNRFVTEQKQTEAAGCLTLVQFDNRNEVNYERLDLQEVPLLDEKTYQPRGSTALLDAIGRTAKDYRRKLKKSEENLEDLQVVFVIITDGHENASIHYNRQMVFKLIRKAEEKWGWQFVYLGANQDAIEEADQMGIMASKAMTFVADSDGMKNLFLDLSTNIHELRLYEREFSFKEDQRKKQKRD